jgi:ABC-2 type transport system ATP-binding protein
MTVVEIEGLTKDYAVRAFIPRKQRALDGLSLTVEEGEVVGIIGPNGAGKTTTLKLLFGHIFPTSGRALVLGRPAGDVPVRAQLGYLPESPYFYDHLKGRELLDYFARLFGLSRAERRTRIAEVLARVDLTAAAETELRRYSKGMLQRIGLAQAILNRPRLVFLDEPMSGLDPLGRREVARLIHDLHRSGVTVVFSSHILSDVEALCDRVAILHRGRLVRAGRLDEIRELSRSGVELIVEGASEALLADLRPAARDLRAIGGRLRIEVAADGDVDRVLDLLRTHGARLSALNPVRESLEEYFVRQVATPASPRQAGDAA